MFSTKTTLWKNPPVKPKRKKMKNGKYRKEPAKKYVDRFKGNTKSGRNFQTEDKGVRRCSELRGKVLRQAWFDSVMPDKTQKSTLKTTWFRGTFIAWEAADRLEDTYEDGQEVPEWWKSKMSVAAKDADTLKQMHSTM